MFVVSIIIISLTSLAKVSAEKDPTDSIVYKGYNGKEYKATPISPEKNETLNANSFEVSAEDITKARLQDDLVEIQDWLAVNNIIDVGGIYVDKDGNNVVQLTKSSADFEQKIRSLSKYPKNLRIEYVKYTESENKAQKEKLLKLAENGVIKIGALGINPELNKVNVYISENDLKKYK